MTLLYQSNGSLVPGIYELSFEEFKEEYGFNKHREKLISGLLKGMSHLKDVGCSTIWVDGSFTTKKQYPNDYDACWDPEGVNLKSMSIKYPALFSFLLGTKTQKEIYMGEFFPSTRFLSFFQADRDDNPKGIIRLKI